MVAFALGVQAQMEAPFQQLGLLNNIEVRSRAAEIAQGQDGSTTTVLDDQSLARLESLPGVAYVYPDLRVTEATVLHEQASRTAVAVGVAREASLVSFFGELLVAGRFFSLDAQPEVILAEQLIEELAFKSPQQAIGERVTVTTAGLVRADDQQFKLHKEQLDVVVVGVFRVPPMAMGMGGNAILLPVDLMRHLPGTAIERNLHRLRSGAPVDLEGFSQVIVHCQRPRDVLRVERAIRQMGFETRALIDELQEARKVFLFMEVLLAAVGTVGLVVAGLGIVNTLLMSVLERYQEIGIYKAIGASDTDVRVLFLTEAALVGFVGGLGGLVLARVVSSIIQWGVHAYAVRQGFTAPLVLFAFPFWLLGGAVLFATAVSILGGLYPASRAARVDPIRALRAAELRQWHPRVPNGEAPL